MVLAVGPVLDARAVRDRLQDFGAEVSEHRVRDALDSLYLDAILRPAGSHGNFAFVSQLIREVLSRQAKELEEAGLFTDFVAEAVGKRKTPPQ